jgi:hypothetical protein
LPQKLIDTNGEMAQFTTKPPALEKRGTSSHPPAKSTRNGAPLGARIHRTILLVDTGLNFGGVLGSTT